ncbi:MAG TPA: alpha/beta hydrolase [Thermoleophilaceae bacterium]|nr:alpha/beta hydrolase [Thermoleophilaceae bacterium]
MQRLVRAPDGVEIACEVGGRGPALVAVHGAGSGSFGFALIRPLLEERFTLWTVDRRGRGASGDADAYALELEVDDLEAVMAAAGERAFLFGHSYGGLVAALTAARLPALPGLVLYEPPMGGVLAKAETIDRWEALIRAGERDLVVREFLADVGGYAPEEIDAMRATPAWTLRLAIVHTVPRELRAELGRRLPADELSWMAAPTLMLVGTESPRWATRSTGAYADVIPNVEVRSLEGEGHGATVGAPELVAAQISGFFSGAA